MPTTVTTTPSVAELDQGMPLPDEFAEFEEAIPQDDDFWTCDTKIFRKED